MELEEMRNLSVEELVQKEKELRKEIFNLRYQLMSEQGANPGRIKVARREIARIQTLVCEKRVAPAVKPGS